MNAGHFESQSSLKYGNSEAFTDPMTAQYRRQQSPASNSSYTRLAEAVLASALYDLHGVEKFDLAQTNPKHQTEFDRFFGATVLSKINTMKITVLWLLGGINPKIKSFITIENVCAFLDINHDAMCDELRKTRPIFREFELLIEIERRQSLTKKKQFQELLEENRRKPYGTL